MFPFGVSAKTLAMCYRQLATMHGAGVPIGRALDTLTAQPGSGRLKRALSSIQATVTGGATLADAFGRQTRVFPSMHVSIIAAGEASGNLEESLQSLANLVERGMMLRRKLVSGLVYPFLLFHAIAVIPAVVRLLFPSTQSVFPVDPLMPLLVLYGALLGVFLACKILGAVGAVISILEAVLLVLPVLGGIWRKITLARFSRFLATLVRSGLPILQSIGTSAEASGSRALRRAAHRTASRVEGGESLSEAFQCSRLFDPMFVNMVATGEESGRLDEMLDKVAEYSEGQAETAIEALLKIVPLVIYLAVAAYAAMAIIGAFTKLYSFAGI